MPGFYYFYLTLCNQNAYLLILLHSLTCMLLSVDADISYSKHVLLNKQE